MKKRLMLLACGLLIGGLVSCGDTDGGKTPIDDGGMNFEQNDDIEKVNYQASVVGTSWANWQPADSWEDENLRLTKVSDLVYTITIDVTPEDGFKVILDGAWTTQYGMEDVDWSTAPEGLLVGKKEDYNEGAGNRSNIKVTRDATIKVDYHPYYFLEEGVGNFLLITEVTK